MDNKNSELHHSAGGVVVGPNRKIAITNQHGDSWSLPKGHLEPGESAQIAAIREIKEETGLNVSVIQLLGEYTRPRIGKGGHGNAPDQFKHITMFLCTTEQTELLPEDPDNPEAMWVDSSEVNGYLTHNKDKEFFKSIIPVLEDFIRKNAA